MVIAAIAAGLVSVNLGVLDRRSANDEVERLERVLQFASERAAVRGTALQVEFLPASYRFSALDAAGKWELLFKPVELAEHAWQSDVSVKALSVDEQAATAGNFRIVFAAESPPFTLDVSTPDGLRRISGNSAGEVTLERDE